MTDECCAGFVFGKKSKMAAPITDSKYCKLDGYAKHSK